MVDGPATTLAWSWEFFLLSFARSRLTRRVLGAMGRFTAFWLTYLDAILASRPPSIDRASALFFLGRKTASHVTDQEIVAGYRGWREKLNSGGAESCENLEPVSVSWHHMGQPFVCDRVVDRHGRFREAKIAWSRDGVSEWQVGDLVAPRRPFVVDGLPVEAHCHGIGPHDFSVVGEADLDDVEAALAREGTFCVPSMFLEPSRLRAVEVMLEKFSNEQTRFPHILGFALEGPLLGSTGGTPQIGSWYPSPEDWECIAMLGRLGLLYIVLSPDAFRDRADLETTVSLLTTNGVAVALGHFGSADSSGSAQAIRDVIDVVASGGDSRRFVWTDHLFNDMPLTFRHAWRTPPERAARDREVAALRLDEWSLSNLASKVGAVPATLITAAADDKITLFLNFDGEHVDTAVARRTVELVGDASLIALTDRIDTHTLAGVRLAMKPGSSLWYADSGVVAAGSCSADRQRNLLLHQGYSDASAWRLTALNALRLLDVPSTHCSYVSETGDRTFMHRLV